MNVRILVSTLLFILTATLISCSPDPGLQTDNSENQNLFIIGQDLSAIRGYMNSQCCVLPDGGTAYIDIYDLSLEDANFGGLGIDLDGKPIASEAGWDAGPVSNDSNILRIAELAKHVEGNVFLRIGYEFEGMWNQGYEDAERYKTAWRRVVDTLRATDQDNIIFVWQGAASTTDNVIEQGRVEDIQDWYPGDDYVDWVGISWFMNPDEKVSIPVDFDVPTARILADELVEFARRKGKPVMIAEAAPQGFDLLNLTERHHAIVWDGEPGTAMRDLSADEIWDYWFEPMFDYMRTNDDVIDALAYINVNWDAQGMWGPPYESGYWGDTRVEANPEITKRWNTAILDWRGR